MSDFPVAFLYFVSDFECSQVLQFIHDQFIDIFDFYQHGVNIIGFTSVGGFEQCKQFCFDNNFTYVAYYFQLSN